MIPSSPNCHYLRRRLMGGEPSGPQGTATSSPTNYGTTPSPAQLRAAHGHETALPLQSGLRRFCKHARTERKVRKQLCEGHGYPEGGQVARHPSRPILRACWKTVRPQPCSRCSFGRTPCRLFRRMLASVALRTSMGSRVGPCRSAPAGRRRRGTRGARCACGGATERQPRLSHRNTPPRRR